jgi:hypothetical protein
MDVATPACGGRLVVDLIRVDLMRLTLIDPAPRNDMIRDPQSEVPDARPAIETSLLATNPDLACNPANFLAYGFRVCCRPERM